MYDQLTTQILLGVVGSQAYGLATEDSDTDRLGIFAYRTEEILSLKDTKDTFETHEPSDVTRHEAGKFIRLALKCNPTITELLWLPEYEVMTDLGNELINIRTLLLSKSYVRNAYFGYATEQFYRIQRAGRFPDVPVNRIEKHARHLLRLLNQGFQLYTEGNLSVVVDHPEAYFEFGRVVVENHAAVEPVLQAFHREFEKAQSNLPESPDFAAANDWLINLRKELL